MDVLMDNGDNLLYKVKRVQWLQPTLESTSGGVRVLSANNSSILLEMLAEVSGQSQVIELYQWWNRPYISCVGTGTLQIYLW